MPVLISSAICLDRGYARLSPKAAVLFMVILPRLNCHGKMEGDIYAIKGLCCRYIDYINIKDLHGLLHEITRNTSVKWWEDADGNAWIHATKYGDYNKGLRKDRMGKDKLPSYKNEELPGDIRSEGEEEGEGEGEGKEDISTASQSHPNSKKLGEEVYSQEFLAFWRSYPRRVGKGAAWKAWQKANPTNGVNEEILSAVTAQSKSQAWKRNGGEFIPHPATWLNQRRWEDDPDNSGKHRPGDVSPEYDHEEVPFT